MIVCGEEDFLKYLNTYCEKAELRGIQIIAINPKSETVTFELPVIRGDLEAQLGGDDKWIATIKLEYSLDEDWVTLHKFPENLLDDEDYDFICTSIIEELGY